MVYRLLTERLLEDIQFFPVVSLVGPRQVGKTTLAQAIRSRLTTTSVYLDLELTTDLEVLQNAESYLRSHADQCVIIDEVQRKPDLFPLIRALVDQQRQPSRFLLLGSASPDLIRRGSDSLAGRIAYLELTPFALTEVQDQVSWQTHWFRGGFPESLLSKSATFSSRWMDNFIATFVERDLGAMGYQIAAPVLTRFFQILTSVHGNLLNVSDLSRSMGVSSPTINAYLDLLEGGFLINRLPPYSINIAKRLVKSPKLYIRDSGMLHRLARIRTLDELQTHIMVGASWEGYVIEQLRRTTINSEFYFYRTQAGAECDLFVILPDGKRACIEIKYADVPNLTKGFYSSIEDLTPDYVYVIVPQGRTYINKNGVTVTPLADFLNGVWATWIQ